MLNDYKFTIVLALLLLVGIVVGFIYFPVVVGILVGVVGIVVIGYALVLLLFAAIWEHM